jgi:hypothetical protein
MTFEEFNKMLGQQRSDKQKQLNEIHWWVSLSVSSLDKSQKDKTFTNEVTITVPSGRSTKDISRTKEQVIEILDKAKSTDIYQSVFVYMVAKVEDFFSNIIYLILSMDNRRIKGSVPGIDTLKKFDVDEILDSKDKNEIVEKIIICNLINIFYASPQKQKDYFDKVLGIKLDDSLWDSWFEIKASRDIIVHNSGIINEIYIAKSGTMARGVIGDKIPINKNYFDSSLAKMKTIIGKCEVSARNSLRPKKEK